MAATYPVVMSKKANGSVGWLSQKTVEAAGQSYKAGSLVKVAASGAVTIITTADAAAILGIAVQDATGVTGAVAPVEILESGDIFEITLCNNSATPATAALTDLFKKYRLYSAAATGTQLDQSTGTGAVGQIVGFVLDSNGAFTTRVLAKPIATTLATEVGL